MGKDGGNHVRRLEGTLGDIPMFATQVTDLAGRGLGRIAQRQLASLGRVQMRQRLGAVAIRRDGLVVDMVDDRTALRLGWKVEEVDVEIDAGAIAGGGPCDVATDGGGVPVGENGGVGDAEGIVVDNGGGAGEGLGQSQGGEENGGGEVHLSESVFGGFYRKTGALAGCGEEACFFGERY